MPSLLSVRAPSSVNLTGLHRQAQTECSQDRGQGIKPRIATLRECPVQRLTGKSRFFGERRHSANRVSHSTQCHGNRSLIAVCQHRFEVLSDLNLVF
jgi:hypothetical protein